MYVTVCFADINVCLCIIYVVGMLQPVMIVVPPPVVNHSCLFWSLEGMCDWFVFVLHTRGMCNWLMPVLVTRGMCDRLMPVLITRGHIFVLVTRGHVTG